DELDQNQDRVTQMHDNTSRPGSDEVSSPAVSNNVPARCHKNEVLEKTICQAVKCRILYARGIIRHPML
ncbi:MAG: hypothetical protein ACK53Y_23955, partial [bacterium]